MNSPADIDVSVFPVFKEQTLKLVDELEVVYMSGANEATKAARFFNIMTKYGVL